MSQSGFKTMTISTSLHNERKYAIFAAKSVSETKRMKKKRLLIGLGITLLVLASGIAAGYACLMNRPLQIKEATFLYIDEDDNIDSVYYKLENRLHASRLTGFRLLASYTHYADHIHTGAYRFQPEERTWNIFRTLQAGNQTPVSITVPSVRTIGHLCKAVSRQLMTDSAAIARLLNDSAYCAALGYDSCTLPALFIPNTYEVYWNIDSQDFIARMQKEHQRFWNDKRTAQAKAIGLTPIEVSTLASIVDEETANQAEKPIVAGLYMNRLQRGILLQADPTVKFSLKAFGLRRILHKHLETDSPYNTYKYAGLPPGPIRIPSIQGIESVLNYTHHDYLYMCAKEDFSGTHNFARTLSQHLANARRYQQALNRRNIR